MLALVFLALAASVNALFTPLVRSPHAHHALAARVAAPEPLAAAAPIVAVKPLRKRQSGRCSIPATSSSPPVAAAGADPAASSSPVAAPATSSSPAIAASPPPAVAAAGADPANAFSSSSTVKTPTPAAVSSPTSAAPPPPSSTPQVENPAPSPPSGSSKPPLSGGPADGTFYATGLGACGWTNTDSDMIAAISEIDYDAAMTDGNPNHDSLCGRKVEATYMGKSVVVTLVDRCVACGEGALDFSPAAFAMLADPNVGRIHGMTWKSVD